MPTSPSSGATTRHRPNRPDPFTRLMNWLSDSHQDQQPPKQTREGTDPFSRLMNRVSR
jgi:hypothetical protein